MVKYNMSTKYDFEGLEHYFILREKTSGQYVTAVSESSGVHAWASLSTMLDNAKQFENLDEILKATKERFTEYDHPSQ
jgi:hypothetical protein